MYGWTVEIMKLAAIVLFGYLIYFLGQEDTTFSKILVAAILTCFVYLIARILEIQVKGRLADRNS